MTVSVRSITADELPAFIETLTAGFYERVDVARVAEAMATLWDLDRTWAAFDGERMCGTLRSWSTELTVPGGTCVPGSAITGVTVLPTHRRRGLLTSLMAAEDAAIRERGEVLGLLNVSEYPIYGRFGYGPATLEATWTVDTNASAFHGLPSGKIELATPSPDLRDELRTMFDLARRHEVGSIRRRDLIWDFDLGLRIAGWGEDWKGFAAVHRDASGSLDGFARYHIEDKWEHRQPRASVKVDDLQALTVEGAEALWRYLCGLDWVATVEAPHRSPSERLPWLLTNSRAAHVSDVGDGLWVRIVDLQRALEARSYDREASLVLEVVEPAASGGGRTRVKLDAAAGRATCRVTTRSPDLTIGVAALGAAYLGGTRLRDIVVATGADEHRSGALLEAEALFRTPDPPWCSTFF